MKMIGNANKLNGLYIIKSQDSEHVLDAINSYKKIFCGRVGTETICNDTSMAPFSSFRTYSSVFGSKLLDNILLWHNRLGHPNFVYLKKLMPELFVSVDMQNPKCETCILAKQTRVGYLPKGYESSSPFNLVHTVIWGSSKVATLNGAKWFITFVDDHTRVTWTYLMKNKSEVGVIFKNFISLIKNQFNTTVKVLRSDNGSEYLEREMKEYMISEGIHHQTSCVYTPQQNGVAERKNRHLLEVTLSIMFAMNVSKFYWGEAILTARYLINRMPSRVLSFYTPKQSMIDLYPHSKLFSMLPFKTLGCVVYVHIPLYLRTKLDKKTIKCIFLGYSSTQKGYKCYCPLTRKMFVSLDVTFDEQHAFYTQGKMISQPGAYQYWSILDIAPAILPTNSTNDTGASKHQGDTAGMVPERDDGSAGHVPGGSTEHFLGPFGPQHGTKRAELPITCVYTRRNNAPGGLQVLSGNDNPNELSTNTDNLPIALRKGTRECTKHPLYAFLAYDRLGYKLHAFTSNLDS